MRNAPLVRRSAATLALALACSQTALATPRRAAALAPAQRRISIDPPAPPAPVALQLTGLRIFNGAPRGAVVHALARDAWPSLVQCAAESPRARGYASVELSETTGRMVARVSGPPLAHNAALGQCLQRALGALVLPPREDDSAVVPEVSVSFELAFALPPVGAPRPSAVR